MISCDLFFSRDRSPIRIVFVSFNNTRCTFIVLSPVIFMCYSGKKVSDVARCFSLLNIVRNVHPVDRSSRRLACAVAGIHEFKNGEYSVQVLIQVQRYNNNSAECCLCWNKLGIRRISAPKIKSKKQKKCWSCGFPPFIFKRKR